MIRYYGYITKGTRHKKIKGATDWPEVITIINNSIERGKDTMFKDIAINSKHLAIIGGYVISINGYDTCYAYKLNTDDTCDRVADCNMQDTFYNDYGGVNMYRVYEFLVK